MGTKVRGIRLDYKLIENIEVAVTKEEKQFNKIVVDAIKEYLERHNSELIKIGKSNYYPVHLTNEELVMIINDFMKNFENEYNCIIKVRTDRGGKGIDFQIDFYSEFKNKIIKKRRYSFSVNAFWEIEEILEHQINGDDNDNLICVRLNVPKTLIISEIVNYNSNRKASVELNSLFKDEKWKVLFERKYPVLKSL